MGNKPRIRFKGFTEDWEQRKFLEITYLSGIKNKENKPYESYSISNEFGFIPQNEQFENGGTMKTADKSMYYIVTQNSFAYNPARINVGSIGYYDKPDNVIVSSLYEVFKTTEIVNDKFLWHWFKSNQFNHLIEKYQEGGVRLYFYYDKLCKGTIELPTIDEQNKISNLLDGLDLYITLHQCKLEKLKLTKKALLQKLFPKNGKHIPEIRFKGFTDAWEQRKLIDTAKTFIGLVTTMTENYRDSGTLLIRNSDIKEGQFVFSEKPIHLDEEFAEKNKTRRLQIGDVVTVHTGDIGTSAVIQEKEAGAIGFATINTRTDKRILNPYFLSTYFNTEKHKCYANSVSTGDGRSNYNIKDFNKLVISIPTLDEQEKISVLINNINTIITLHQRKLERLQEVKKGLLQKMFV